MPRRNVWRARTPPPTLPRMAQNEKTDKHAPYVPAWTADPWVVVSKRMRNLNFPAVLLTRDPTKEELEAWRKGPVDVTAPVA